MAQSRKEDCGEKFCGWGAVSQKCAFITCPLEKQEIKMSHDKFYSHERWETLISTTVSQIQSLAKLKGGEYSGDIDRLANFRRNGKSLKLPMETIWAVYAAKHWDAIQQYIVDERDGMIRKRMEPIEGRVDDLLVYLLLFKAMLEEKHG